ncbi:MAG: glycoside hydrolase family 30 protein [Bacteroidales bacterium]
MKTWLTGVCFFLMACIRVEPDGNYPDPPSDTNGETDTDIHAWVTHPAANILFQRNKQGIFFATDDGQEDVIRVDSAQRYQSIDGFGNCLTGGSALLLNRMSQEKRQELLKELFDPRGPGIGISYLRISIGASDLSDRVYSYDDMPPGQTDPLMEHFSLDPDREHLIPVLKEILAICPDLKILGSPWSAPVWMKTNQSSIGGSLRHEYFDAYARYFVRYIQAMKEEGIIVDAITVQNEPLHPGNNPSMFMSAEDQAKFIRENLGPAFEDAGITTKIIIYDHNCDRPDYPISVLSDPQTARYIDGSAFHLYGGTIDAMSTVHEAFPNKNLYFTEQWIGGPGDLATDLKWHVENLIIGATRNWSRNVLEWNLASDPNYDPHTEGGCDRCLGTVTINGDRVTRNPAYYILAHAAKFVRPGSVRINSNLLNGLPNVAFQTPDGRKALIVLNTSRERMRFGIGFDGKLAWTELGAGAVGTYLW